LISWIYKITPISLRADLTCINQEIGQVWKTYLRGQFMMMLLIGIASGIGGFVVGLRNALIIGLIAGLLEIVPSLGPTISTIIAGVTAWTHGSLYLEISNFWFAVLVCGIFIVIQVIENTILLPRVMSRHMNLHPALVFVAVVSTLTLYGVIAALIVLPLIASAGVIFQYIYQKINESIVV
jgi:predicted PurR-regulated permease PerM